MKIFFTLLLIALFFLPTTSFAAKGDFKPVGTLEQCKMIKYSCDIGWNYATNETHCGCAQILSDTLMQSTDVLVSRLLERVEALGLDAEKERKLMENIKNRIWEFHFKHLDENENKVLKRYIIEKIFEIYGEY